MAKKKIERVPTGIKGFDRIIEGGLERGSLIVLSGNAGTGKTIFSLQFLYNGATKFKENGAYITFEESEEDLIKDGESFGWDMRSLIKKEKIIIKEYPPFAFEQFLKNIENIIINYDIKRLVIDSTSIFGLYSKDPFEMRKKMYELMKKIKELKVTTIAIAETNEVSSSEIRGFTRFGVEEFVADGLVTLHYAGFGGMFDRSLQVVKMRRTNHKHGLFPVKIGKDGFKVLKQE